MHRMTIKEEAEARREVSRLEAWSESREKNASNLWLLKKRLQKNTEAQARDEKKGRHKRVR